MLRLPCPLRPPLVATCQRAFAESTQNISRYEKNKATPREATLAIFAEAFELPLSEFTSLAAPLDVPNLDPEIVELMRLIPTLEENDQFVIKRVLKALINEKKVKKLLAS